jgi:hypothetical protein
MANTLTGLVPVLYKAMDIVSREMVGMIPSVTINADEAAGAVGQEITSPVTAGATAISITPSNTSPADGDQSVGKKTLTIEKAKMVPVNWTGEEQLAIKSTYEPILIDQFAQAMRVLANEVEDDLCALYVAASRAIGAAGTTPFATVGDFEEAAAAVQILKDNGSPLSDIQLVINTVAGTKMIGKQSRADVVGDGNIRKLQQQGILLSIAGCKIRESSKIRRHTKGTGTAYVTSGATAIGGSSIALVTGSNTVLAGDVVTFAADTVNKYVVNTGVAAPGTIALGLPGAMATIPTGNAMTIGNSYTANMAFARSAIHLAVRTPAMPKEGDQADDVMVITDPVSGLPFQIAMYRQYRRVHFEVGLAWGRACMKSEHCAILIG